MKSILIFLLLPLFAIASEPLFVGMDLTFPPFETIDPQGNPTGISVDLAYALGKHLKREIKIIPTPFLGLIPSLKAGKIDLILSSMTVTEERKRAICFSETYLKTSLALLISQKSDLQGIEGADDPKYLIAVRKGTAAQKWAVENLKNAHLLMLDKQAGCILEVIQGKADAFIYDSRTIQAVHEKNPSTTRVNLKAFKNEECAIGLRKEESALLNEVNIFLREHPQ
jgi:polar amino acid transport system substrate-binding protein